MNDGREGGYVKFYRSIESSEDFIGLRPDQSWVAMRIVQLANFKPGFMRFRTQAIPVGRGEVGHTIDTISRRTGATRKVVRTTIDRLVQSGFLGTRTGTVAGTAYRILIVRNYDRFQGEDEETGTVAGTVAGHDRATTGPRPGTKIRMEEGEEGKKEEQIPLAPIGVAPPLKKKTKTGDPTVDALRADLEATYRTTRHEELDWPPSAYGDLQAIRKALADDAEVKRRWNLFLETEFWPIKNVHKFRDAYSHAKFANGAIKPSAAHYPILVGSDSEGKPIFREAQP